jgi:hypothetical protein
MNVKDLLGADNVRGQIKLFETGGAAPRLLLARNNVVVYSAADLMAKLLAGDVDAAPKHIGFIYGETGNPTMADPASLSLDLKRVHPWTKIAADVAADTGNMIICPLVLPAAISLDANSNAAYYAANTATFTAHTGAFMEYAFPTAGGPYAGTLDSLGAIYFWHAVLLNRRQIGSTVTYTPFARVALGSPVGSGSSGSGSEFTPKAANRELAVYWSIIFK